MTDDRVFLRMDSVTKDFNLRRSVTELVSGQARRSLRAVDAVSFDIPRGTAFGLVGESGCGKSTIARMAAGLFRPTEGTVWFDGQDLSELRTRRAQLPVRRRTQMIFQDPFASLDPRWRVRDIIAEPIRTHRLRRGRAAIQNRVDDLLTQVGLVPSDGLQFPHEFSGGQRQRIAIARALASEPDLLVCDEPTSALDVSVQAQVLNLLDELRREHRLTYLFISHNLAVVNYVCDQIGVMYLGRLVEWGSTHTILTRPSHPYTRMLLDSVPDLRNIGREATSVTGEVANPIDPPSGCVFHPRCSLATDRCAQQAPRPARHGAIAVACHAVDEGRAPALELRDPDAAQVTPKASLPTT